MHCKHPQSAARWSGGFQNPLVISGQIFPRIVLTNLTGSSATLTALVNPNGAATSWYYQYGLTTNYSSFGWTNTLPSGNGAVVVSNVLVGLLPNTFYHYQLVARNSAGITSGADATFTLLAVPAPILIAPSVLGDATFQFTFTNISGAAFTVLATADMALPLTNWSVLGSPTPIGGAVYQFTDPGATNFPRRFYLLRSP